MNKFFSTGDKGRWTTDAFTEAVYGDPDLLRDVMAHMRSLPDVNFANPKKDSPAIYHVELVTEPVQLLQALAAESSTEERVLTPDFSDGKDMIYMMSTRQMQIPTSMQGRHLKTVLTITPRLSTGAEKN
jgi:hypothetical protein